MTPLAMCLLTASLTFLYYLMVPLPRSPTLQCSDSFSFKDILELLHPVDEIGVKGIIEGGDEKFCLKAVVTDDHPFQGRVFLNFVSIHLQDSLPGLDPEPTIFLLLFAFHFGEWKSFYIYYMSYPPQAELCNSSSKVENGSCCNFLIHQIFPVNFSLLSGFFALSFQ